MPDAQLDNFALSLIGQLAQANDPGEELALAAVLQAHLEAQAAARQSAICGRYKQPTSPSFLDNIPENFQHRGFKAWMR
jgi:hypothetical protein